MGIYADFDRLKRNAIWSSVAMVALVLITDMVSCYLLNFLYSNYAVYGELVEYFFQIGLFVCIVRTYTFLLSSLRLRYQHINELIR